MYKMITTGLLCIAAVALKAQDAPIDSVDHTKSNTLGASSTVYTNDLIKYQSATILTGLQGRLKGLNVSPFRGMQLLRTDAKSKADIVGAIPNVGGGIYGDNSEFLISARGQSPVAIVDGVERDLYSIDPEAIESVTILKDALSNMFLGMRSSRGALIITTKNPDAKGGFHLSLTGKFGISSALKYGPNTLSAYQYAYLLNEALLNDGKSPLYTYDDFEAYRNGTSPYLHPDVNWKDAIMNILPDAATELEFFAAHNSDLGPNGHKYRREESVNLQPTAQSFTESYIKNKTYTEKDFSILQETFSQMIESSDILVAHADKNPIIVEIMPWLYQFKLLGETGNEVLAMVKAYDKNDQSLFMRKYKHVKALQQQMFQIDQTYNQNPYQPGIKTAGRVIKPLIDQTFATVTQCYNQKYSTLLNAETDYMPHKLISDISQIKNLPLQVKINRIQISPALEVIKWPGNGSLTIELDQVYPGENIEIDFGKPEIATWGSLEISANGKDWSKVNFTQKNNRLTASLQQKPIKIIAE